MLMIKNLTFPCNLTITQDLIGVPEVTFPYCATQPSPLSSDEGSSVSCHIWCYNWKPLPLILQGPLHSIPTATASSPCRFSYDLLHSPPNYCFCLQFWSPSCHPPQSRQSDLSKAKYFHAPPLHKALQWFPITFWIKSELLSKAYKVPYDLALALLSSLTIHCFLLLIMHIGHI